MISKFVPRHDVVMIRLGPHDGAFVFRHGKGVEIYKPTDLEIEASDEGLAAMMLAWVLLTPAVRDKIFARFKASLGDKT